MLAAGPRLLGQVLLIDGLVAFLAIAVLLGGRQGDGATAVEVLAVSQALAAAILWTRLEVSALLPLLVGFVVWTIAAERVELARLTLGRGADHRLLVLAAVYAAGSATALLSPAIGSTAGGPDPRGVVRLAAPSATWRDTRFGRVGCPASRRRRCRGLGLASRWRL